MTTSTPRRPDVTETELIGGPEALTVGLHDYDPSWAQQFEEHRRRILEALAGLGRVSHILSEARGNLGDVCS